MSLEARCVRTMTRSRRVRERVDAVREKRRSGDEDEREDRHGWKLGLGIQTAKRGRTTFHVPTLRPDGTH